MPKSAAARRPTITCGRTPTEAAASQCHDAGLRGKRRAAIDERDAAALMIRGPHRDRLRRSVHRRGGRGQTQPFGTGPTRFSAMVPDEPLLVPPVKVKLNVAAEQLGKASVPVPTATVCGPGTAAWSKTPPVVW